MSLLEGYSNHVMNAAGEQILPGFAQLHDRFERRNERRGAIEQAIMRITGLDLKMEQYAAGERFVDAVLAPVTRRSFVGSGRVPIPCHPRGDPRPAPGSGAMARVATRGPMGR